MCKIISRRDSVRRIAQRSGFSKERAEDIAQEAALQLVENPNLVSQSSKQAFIDALRRGGEGSHSRAGVPRMPLFESQFKDYPKFMESIGDGRNLEGEQISRSDLSAAVSMFKILSPRSRTVMEMHAQGFSLVEISKQYGISSSRVSEIINISRVRIKEAIVSQGLSQQKQRQRKFSESQALPFKKQIRPRVQAQDFGALVSMAVKAIEGMVSFKIPKIPQELFMSF
jgi:DNA-directed RNA polymerase specialized sigma24 family protein